MIPGVLASSIRRILESFDNLWTPMYMTTALWLDAADQSTITLNESGQVFVWNDKSGNTRHATFNRNPLPPISDFSNGLPAIDFNNSRADFAPEVLVSASFVYFVGRCHGVGDGNEGQILSNSSRNHQFRFVNGPGNVGVFGVSPVPSWGNGSSTTGMGGRLNQPVFGGVDLGNGKFYTLGSADFDGGAAVGADFFFSTLGARSVSSEPLNGAIAEVIICHRSEDRERIEGYLAWKWGLQYELPAYHTYKNSPPVVPSLGELWTPSYLNSTLWLDAADDSTVITVDGFVEEFQDKSGNNNHFPKVTDTSRPTRVENGVQFDHTSLTVPTQQQYLERTGVLLRNYPYECFIMADNVTAPTASQGVLISSDTATTAYSFMSSLGIVQRNTSYLQASFTVDWSESKRNLLYGRWEQSLRRGEVNAGAPVDQTTSQNTIGTSGKTRLGRERDASLNWPANALSGTTREIILVHGGLPTVIKHQIEGYLAHKWDTNDELLTTHSHKHSPPIYDPHWNNVELLMHMDGANASTTFTDYSPSQRAITRSGTTQISTVRSRFGSSSLFNGSVNSGNGLAIPNAPNDFLVFPGDFSVELWYYQTADTEFGFSSLISRVNTNSRESAATTSFELGVTQATGLYYPVILSFNTNTETNAQIVSSITTSLNNWNHMAVTRHGDTLRLFVNGKVAGTRTVTGQMVTNPAPSAIGASMQSNTTFRHSFRGYIDGVRVTRNVARYTAAFDMPTAPMAVHQ